MYNSVKVFYVGKWGRAVVQRYAVRTEAACCSPVLGQNLESDLFPHPSRMSKSTFCPGIISSRACFCMLEKSHGVYLVWFCS